jgi:hypothetical protein
VERLAERGRSATPAAEPQTEAHRSCGTLRMLARDERAVCGVERAASRGIRGDGQPVECSKLRVGHGSPRFKTFFATTKTILQLFRQVRAGGV